MASVDHTMGLASLAIGTGGVTIQLFHVAKAAFGTYTGALSFDEASSILKAKLVIEESRLCRWGEVLGIPDMFALPDPADPLQVSDVKEKTPLEDASMALLTSAVQLLLGDLETLKTRYGLAAAGAPPPQAPAAIVTSGSTTAEIPLWLKRMVS